MARGDAARRSLVGFIGLMKGGLGSKVKTLIQAWFLYWWYFTSSRIRGRRVRFFGGSFFTWGLVVVDGGLDRYFGAVLCGCEGICADSRAYLPNYDNLIAKMDC